MNIEHIDTEMIEELKDVMEGEFTVLMITYIKNSKAILDGLHQLLEDENFDALSKMAHSFKGSCGNIGALPLAELCRLLEVAGANCDAENAQSLLKKIVIEFEEVSKLISHYTH